MAKSKNNPIRSDKPYSVLVDGCFSLSVSFSLIGGKKKLNPEDIGLNPDDLPKNAIHLGSKQVIPKEVVKELTDLKKDLLDYLSTIGFKIHGVWNIPLGFYDEVMTFIDKIEAKFIEVKRRIILNVQEITREWADSVEAERPGMRDVILRNAYSPEYIANKVQFEHIFWQNAQDVAALSLFRDVADTAKKQLDEIVKGQNKCTKQTCLDRLIGIKKKLSALRFVDDNVDLVIKRIDRFIKSCPQKGKLPENFAENLAVELAFLSNAEQLMSLNKVKIEETEENSSLEEIQSRMSEPDEELKALLAKTPPEPGPTPQAELDFFSIC